MFNPPSFDTMLKVRRIGITKGHFSDFYHWVMAASWWKFILTAGFVYMCVNASFATLYYLGGDVILNARPKSFVDAFLFSFQTSTTIGYGYFLPKSPYAHVIVMFDVIVGILYVAVVTGLAFAKFARPRPRVLFSDRALIVEHESGNKALVFRIANGRSTQIVNAGVSVGLIRRNDDPKAITARRVHDLKLVRNQTQFFVLSWMVIHVIDESSPLYGLGQDDLAPENVRIHVTFTGIDDIYAQTVHWWHGYTAEQIVFANRFIDMVTFETDDSVVIDYTKIHEFK